MESVVRADLAGAQGDCCDATGQERTVKREAFKHKHGFVILENVPVGVCDRCGYRYYHSALRHRVVEIAARKEPAVRVEPVPVAPFA